MSDVTNPHDSFFRETFGRKEIAAGFLREYLPRAILRKIDLESLTAVKDSFVEKELRQHFSDLLYRVRYQEHMLYLYLLFEHKSSPDPWTGLQLLRYLVRFWEQHRKQHPKDRKLPAVVPLVLYHGRKKWRFSDRFSSLIVQNDDELAPFIPNFSWKVHDLSVLSDEEIRGGVFDRITLLVLRHIFDPDLHSRLPKILSLLQDAGEKQDALEMLELLLRYVVRATKTFDEDAVREVLDRSGVGEDFMQNFIDKYISPFAHLRL
ncbi:Rpn family recombination-promoting nuclease/putative transposase [Candidatus Electrothrix sp.]|uniref:Rpn family recombination-promoting nuclease/putative transposase n=1 Tax=Candidatus Electrothrix sp. TaxID=2170559 RepID=UPI00405644DE